MENKLDPIFSPKSIAVIGASRHKGKVGWEILHNLIEYGFQGKIYPVNPKADVVHSIKCHPSVLDIPDNVDLAVIVVPAAKTLEVMEECGKKGVKGSVVISAGFKETGERGAELERKLHSIAKRYGIRMVGPNCMGVINTHPQVRMDATFAAAFPLQGKISFMSQSGALCAAILEHAKNIKVGFAKFVSMGNKVDVSGNDLLMAWKDDPETDLILMYIESFGNPRNFTKIARRIARKKPLIALKSGRTEAGARASISHTGALAGLDVATDALFEQCGVLRVGSIEELFDLAVAFSMQPLPKGGRVAVVTNAGGPGIMAVDALVSVGLEVARLSERTKRELRRVLPKEASVDNPIDMIADADAERYEKTMDQVLKDRNVDSVIVISVPPVMANEMEIAKAIVKVSKRHKKTILSCFLGRGENSPGFVELASNSIPSYLFPESAAKALASMCKYRGYVTRQEGELRSFDVDARKVREIFHTARKEGRTRLKEMEVLEVLRSYGFSTARTSKASNEEEEAVSSAKEIGYPLVLKALSPKIVHKSDVGAVALDIRNEEELKRELKRLEKVIEARGFQLEGYLLQEMVRRGKETVLGMSFDKKFGPILMFGLGGIYVEVFKDVAFRLTPLTDLDALRMIQSIKTYPLLEGIRGEKPCDIPTLMEYLQRLSQLAYEFDEIQEMDINPLMVFEKGKGCKVVDARMVLKELS